MTTPQVTELPRRLEPTGADTFLGARDETRSVAPPSQADARGPHPLALVLPLRPRDPLAARRPLKPRRGARRPPRPGGMPGPGGDAA